MIPDIINNSLYWELILAFLIVAYIFMRWVQRRFQKMENMDNMEFWIYYNLVDYYKFHGYPYPEIRAKKELQEIIKNKNIECNLEPK